MRAGRLRNTVIFQYDQTSTRDAAGMPVVDWVRRAKRRAAIRPLRGKEFESAQQVYGETSHEIVVRYDSATKLITPKDRALYGDRIFNITHILNPNERNEELKIYALELVGETYTPETATATFPAVETASADFPLFDYVLSFSRDIVEGPEEIDGWTLEVGGLAKTITSVRIESGTIIAQADPGAQVGGLVLMEYDGSNGIYYANNEYEFTVIEEE